MKNKLNRRQFITRTIGAGAGVYILGNPVFPQTQINKTVIKDPLQEITIGRTGIKTTFLGMGTGYSGGNNYSNRTRAKVAEALIRQAYEKGVRFFDCADSYGTHPYVAAALKGIPRENYVIVTKMWAEQHNQGGIDADVAIDRFRKELNIDYIDIVQIHCMTDPQWTDKQKKQMDILENLKNKNIIKAHGVSVHSLDAMKTAAESSWVDVIHVRINPYGEAMDEKDPALVVPVIEKLHNSGKGVIGMKLAGNSSLNNYSEKIDNSLKYVLGLGSVDLITIGFEKPEQIDDYMARIKRAV